MMKYLELYGIDYKNLTERPCHQKFTFGSSKYLSEEIVEVPITMKTNEGKHVSFAEATYILKDSNTPFLLGKKTLKVWKAQINIADDELNIKINDNGKLAEKVIPMIDGSHPMVELQTESDDEEVVHYVNDNWNDISTYKGVKKVHKVHGNKSENNLLHAYKSADLLTTELKKTITRVVNDCKVCKKFKKTTPRPKSSLPKSSDFNQVVTLDLKKCQDKYILWIICSFTRYMQGCLIPNKEAETIFSPQNHHMKLKI